MNEPGRLLPVASLWETLKMISRDGRGTRGERLKALLRRLVDHARWRQQRMKHSVHAAGSVDQPAAYMAREISRRRVVGEYTLNGVRFWLEHGTQDVQIFQEIAGEGFYRLPFAVSRRLEGRDLRVADLGGNIGIFGLWITASWPAAAVVIFEPDAVNASKYRRFLDANDLEWELIEACAAAQDGTVLFASGLASGSHIATSGGTEVATVDALPELLRADVIKMDIEGGEWDHLLDDRFRNVRADVIMMEYHPFLCPEGDARALAARILEDIGYDVTHLSHAPQGHGMLRGVRF